MKKTLLGFGLLPLAILSVGVVASCSSTEEPTVSTLEKEATKFNASVVAKDKTITAAAAAAKIVPIETPERRLAALRTIATTIPSLSTGFTMIVNSASVSGTTPTSVQVNITITETASAKTKNVVLTITGFMTASKLEIEASKFNVPVEPKDKTMMAPEAASKIVATESEDQKLAALNTIAATVPTLGTGFTMTINSAKVSATDPSTVEVAITITETSSTNTKDVVLRITGFLTREALLELEAAKFEVIRNTNDSVQSAAKYLLSQQTNFLANKGKTIVLNTMVRDFPKIDESKYTMLIGFITVIDDIDINEMIMQIPITISTIDSPILSSKTVFLKVKGFIKPSSKVEIAAANFQRLLDTKDKTIIGTAAAASIKTTDTPAQRLTALKLLADVPALDTGFTMTVNSAETHGPTNVKVNITITETSSGSTATAFLIIQNFSEI